MRANIHAGHSRSGVVKGNGTFDQYSACSDNLKIVLRLLSSDLHTLTVQHAAADTQLKESLATVDGRSWTQVYLK